MTQQTTQLALPYATIEKVANRDTMRKKAAFLGKQTYHLPVSCIAIREGFNVRLQPGDMMDKEWLEHLQIEELAADIAANGLNEPLLGDLLEDGTFVLTDGYRRYLAIKWLLENCHTTQANGKPMDAVEVIPNPTGTTEKDRVIRMLSSDKKLPFSEMEMARGLKRLKDCFSMSNQEISDKMGRSRQWVDNKLKLTSLSPEKQQAIESGELKSTNALAEARNPLSVKKNLTHKEMQQLADSFSNNQGALPINLGEDENITGTNPIKTITETKKALDEELASRKTDGKFREQRPKNDQEDALAKIDFKQEKTEAEMELNEVKKMLDKINVMCDHFPDKMKQTAGDIQNLCAASVRKVEYAQNIIKKASDER